jgi:hypothetical protein
MQSGKSVYCWPDNSLVFARTFVLVLVLDWGVDGEGARPRAPLLLHPATKPDDGAEMSASWVRQRIARTQSLPASTRWTALGIEDDFGCAAAFYSRTVFATRSQNGSRGRDPFRFGCGAILGGRAHFFVGRESDAQERIPGIRQS